MEKPYKFLSTRKTTPNALTALQGYGPTTWSLRWNIDEFSNLNLNSIEEEDAFLYGDSNSVPEEQVCVENDSVISSTVRLDTKKWSAWSDDEETSVSTGTDVKSKFTTPLLDNDHQNEIQDIVKLSHVEREENVIDLTASDKEDDDEKDQLAGTSEITVTDLNSKFTAPLLDNDPQNKIEDIAKPPHIENENFIEYIVPSLEISEKTCVPNKLESHGSVLSPAVERDEFPEVSSAVVRDESQDHIADELPKKQIDEESDAKDIGLNEELSNFPRTSNNVSELDRPSPTDLKTAKPAIKRKNPRVINKKHIDNIKDYITKPQRKRYRPSEESPVAKHAKYETPRSASPSRHHSPNRSSLPSHKPYTTHRSPSFRSEKCPSRYTESYRHYSFSPKKWSRSPNYRHNRRRSCEKGTHYDRYKDKIPRSHRSRSRSPRSPRSRYRNHRSLRSRSKSPRSLRFRSRSPRSPRSRYRSHRSLRCRSKSPRSLRSRSRSPRSCRSTFKSPGYYPTTRAKADVKKRICESPKKSDYYPKKKEKSPFSSADSFCSLSLDSSSSSSSDSSDESSDENSFKKFRMKTILKNTSTLEDELINFKGFYTYSEKSDSTIQREDSISKNVSDAYDVKSSDDGNSPDSVNNHSIPIAVLPSSREQQLIMDFPEQQPITAPASSTSTSAAAIDASDMQIPVISSSEPYDYPTVLSAQVTHFLEMSPSATFPAPIMATPPPTEYMPYYQIPPAPQYLTNVVSKSGKVRPATLRTVPMLDSLPVPSASSSNITVVPNDFKTRESVQSAEQSSKNKPDTLKETGAEENVSSSSELITASKSEQKKRYIEQKKLMALERLKKVKAERSSALYKAKQFETDLHEMKIFQKTKSSNQGWKVDLVKGQNKDANEHKKPVKGAEFVKRLTGFYCVLCKEVLMEKSSVERHLQGDQHCANYDNHIKKNPTNALSVFNTKNVSGVQNKEPYDEKEDIINEDLHKELPGEHIKVQNKALNSNKKKTTSKTAGIAYKNRNRIKNVSTCKAKKPKSSEASKEVHSDNSSEIEKSSNVQKVSSAKHVKDELCSSQCDSCRRGGEKKIVHKYIFIGKCPGMKKKSAEKNKPRCARESNMDKNEEKNKPRCLSDKSEEKSKPKCLRDKREENSGDSNDREKSLEK